MHWRLFIEAIQLDSHEGQEMGIVRMNIGHKTLSTPCTQNAIASPELHLVLVIASPESEGQFGKDLQSYWSLYPQSSWHVTVSQNMFCKINH